MYATDPKAAPKSGTFELPPLPYDEQALEPVISAHTVNLHYDKHHRGYVNKLNELVEGSDLVHVPLDELVRRVARTPGREAIFNNAGQAWNHHFYWRSLTPQQGTRPDGELQRRIERELGGYESFVEGFVKACVGQFGSGWAWLIHDGSKLRIMTTANADTPIAHGITPLLCVDVWEHAYYLDYQNRREEYAQKLIQNLLNWEFATQNLQSLTETA